MSQPLVTPAGGRPAVERPTRGAIGESDDASRGRVIAGHVALTMLIIHAALIVFSTTALVTFLTDPTPEVRAWLATEPNATVYRIAWRFSGPTYVVAGFLAAAAHAMARLGASARTIWMLIVVSLLALGSELLGTATGFPFGGYGYSEMLGYRVLGLVPLPIPISWTTILYCSLAIAGRLLEASDDVRTRIRWSVVGAVVLTAWDVAMDPAMVATFHWAWDNPGAFYGMPATNWLGWLGTGFVLSWVMLSFVPPSAFASRISPTRMPLLLYALNGIMPIAICVRHGMTWAAVGGTLAMGIPLLLALRRPRGMAATPAIGRSTAL